MKYAARLILLCVSIAIFTASEFLFAQSTNQTPPSGNTAAKSNPTTDTAPSTDTSNPDDLFSQDSVPSDTINNEPSVLDELKKNREVINWGFDFSSSGGGFFGYINDYPDLLNPIKDLNRSFGITFSLVGKLDLRPTDNLRIFTSGQVGFPASSDNLTFTSSLQEIFVDYSLPSGQAARFGHYTVGWGNARILGVSDILNRSISLSTLNSSVLPLPQWVNAQYPSTWLKLVFPFDHYSATAVMGWPTTYTGIKDLRYGLLNEYNFDKTALSLGATYRRNFPLRISLNAKTNLWDYDAFIDTAFTSSVIADNASVQDYFDTKNIFTAITAGVSRHFTTDQLYDISFLAEWRWNGEREVNGTSRVADALGIGGFTQAIAIYWNNIAGSPIDLALTNYQSWSDLSGAVIISASADIFPDVKIRSMLPIVYGDKNSTYRTNRPAESIGYLTGLGIALIVNKSF